MSKIQFSGKLWLGSAIPNLNSENWKESILSANDVADEDYEMGLFEELSTSLPDECSDEMAEDVLTGQFTLEEILGFCDMVSFKALDGDYEGVVKFTFNFDASAFVDFYNERDSGER